MTRFNSLLLAAAVALIVPGIALAGPVGPECKVITPAYNPETGNSGMLNHTVGGTAIAGTDQNGFTATGAGSLPSLPTAEYSLIGGPGIGWPDFDGNGITDLAMQHSGGYTLAVLLQSDGGTWVTELDSGPIAGVPGVGYTTVGFPDLNGDGKSDICHQHISGYTVCTLLNGLTPLGSGQIAGPPTDEYRTIAWADLDGDSGTDQVTQHTSGYTLAITYKSDGGTFVTTDQQGPVASPANLTDWQTLAFPDLDNDGDADIVIQHSGGFTQGTFTDGVTATGTVTLPGLAGTADWYTQGFPDLDGNGYADEVVVHSGGYTHGYMMESDGGTSVQVLTNGQIYGNPDANTFTFLGNPDLNCDKRQDIVYQHTSGFTAAYLSGADGLLGTTTAGNLPAAALTTQQWANTQALPCLYVNPAAGCNP